MTRYGPLDLPPARHPHPHPPAQNHLNALPPHVPPHPDTPKESVFLSKEFRIPADQGIAGHVATTGKILNIKDAYSHPLFYRGVDDSTGFRTRNILCFPIKDENNEQADCRQTIDTPQEDSRQTIDTTGSLHSPCWEHADERARLAVRLMNALRDQHLSKTNPPLPVGAPIS
ncbi:hypothetical protein JZ751_013860 [Albula glossodonta]|uniref:Uncharacterized protein n=1 Tax=Albula glossodonta TaxID=121402 RepID=A0A8T2MVI6_9TELE|nr:hypothetical protein JZ751_013860 [Albula glossodonta]